MRLVPRADPSITTGIESGRAARRANVPSRGTGTKLGPGQWNGETGAHGEAMIRRIILAAVAVMLLGGLAATAGAQDRAYGRVWGGQYGRTDWERFYHYPYVW